MTSKKSVPLNKHIIRRIEKSGFTIDRKGACIICKKAFRDCPHSYNEVLNLITVARMFTTLRG